MIDSINNLNVSSETTSQIAFKTSKPRISKKEKLKKLKDNEFKLNNYKYFLSFIKRVNIINDDQLITFIKEIKEYGTDDSIKEFFNKLEHGYLYEDINVWAYVLENFIKKNFLEKDNKWYKLFILYKNLFYEKIGNADRIFLFKSLANNDELYNIFFKGHMHA